MKHIATELLPKATCPNCWKDFSTDRSKWISVHESLLGDYRLGSEFQKRFLPSRFDISGNALDSQGLSCQEIACPECHLRIPRAVLNYKPFFVSIAGTPSCGKSFFLASMVWQLRTTLPTEFQLLLTDSDGECNKILNDYEEQLFFSTQQGGLAKLAKTDVAGDWYSTVQYQDHVVTYPKPFYFNLVPTGEHWTESKPAKVSRLLCLYDNAGESFLPGADTVANPVTRHLGIAKSWLFCFDPTQDPRFRRELAGKSNDHQVNESPVTSRQETVLNEMVNRIRRHSDLGMKEKSSKPLVIVCTKYDSWRSLLDIDLPTPWSKVGDSHALNVSKIEEVSTKLRGLLQRLCPEVVASSQALSSNVYFVPASATGVSPVWDESNQDYLIDTAKISPIWCEVPMLIALAHQSKKLLRAGKSRPKRPNQNISS